jgi:monoamine oxidase
VGHESVTLALCAFVDFDSVQGENCLHNLRSAKEIQMKKGESRKSKLSRRDVLRAMGVGAVTTLTPALTRAAENSTDSRKTEVVVVGAGFAGLTAARELVRSGRKVVVLEARDRVGGRVKAGKLAGHAVDVGGMWVGPTQTRVLEMIKEYGLHTRPQFEQGKDISELNGRRVMAEGEETGMDAETQAEYDRVVKELDRLCATVPPDQPWNTPDAEALDSMTLQDWLDSTTHNKIVRAFLEASMRVDFVAEPYQISFLYCLFYLRSGDNFEMLNGYKGAAQAFLVNETMHEVAMRMATEIKANIVLENPVRAISQDGNGVTVSSDKGTWRADYAIVAVPLPLSVRIAYDPPLSPERDALAQHMPMGSVIKYLVAYEKPFWREQGLNGMTWSDLPPSAVICDVSPADGKPGILVGFFEAHNALRWTGKPREERKKVVIERLVEFFGSDAAHPIDYEDQDWPAEVWSRGCYGASMPPGIMTTIGRVIRQPHGRIHWAGTETAARWMGYVDGAIRSGDRAASDVLAAYQKSKSVSVS